MNFFKPKFWDKEQISFFSVLLFPITLLIKFLVFFKTSLTKDSGQNPIEPARLGCKIFHGPYVSNFAEIYKYFNELRISKEVNSSNELSLSLVEEFKDDKPKNLEISAKIENYGQNILNNVTMEIKKYI